jgi:uncharacterized LabA/DUF88 family protein
MIYAYVDGAYLQERSKKALSPLWDDEPELDFSRLREFLNADHLFYYDCIDDTPKPDETAEMHLRRTARQRSMLSKVLEASMCHMRMGTVKGRKRAQKEVDVQIAVDMLTHAQSLNIAKVVLLSGDLDYRPIIESLVQSGITVELCFASTSVAVELKESADIRRCLRLEDWYNLCSAQFQIAHRWPVEWRDHPPQELPEARRGSLAGRLVRALVTGDGAYIVAVDGEPGNMPYAIKSRDLDFLIKQFLPWRHPGIEWEP